MALAVPGGVPAPAGDRVDLLGSQYPNLGEGQYLVRKIERRGNSGQVVVHWHDYATRTVMSRAKALDLVGQEVLERHLAGPGPRAAPALKPTKWESLLLESCRELVSRDQAMLDHLWQATVAHATKHTNKPKPSTLTDVTFDRANKAVTIPNVLPHHALAMVGDSPTETGCGDRTIGKATPLALGGLTAPRVARRILRSWPTLGQVAAWLGTDAAVGDGTADRFAFAAGVARVVEPYSAWHPAWDRACLKGLAPITVDTSVAVANPGAYASAAATAFNAGGGVKWVALLEEREAADGLPVFFRVLLPGGGGYVNLFGRAVVRGHLGWVPASTLELTAHTSVAYTESYAGEAGIPVPATLKASVRCWTATKDDLTPIPCQHST